jgi:4-hydroxy-3-polyprenylbenzoate decarboxylase
VKQVSNPKRIIVGISGASGIIYGIRTLQLLREAGVETHLIVSKAAEMTLAYESDLTIKDLREMADKTHAMVNIGASISSGSFHTLGMIVVPCSVRTMSEIATGVTGSLMSRAADVVLKERRRLVLGVRETPLHSGHLRTMLSLSDMGAMICPVVPAFYNRPKTLDDIVDHTVGRMLDLFDIDVGAARRWKTEE